MRRLRSILIPGAVVFTGDNGAGKTNLLEAISLLTPGRGLRRATYAEVAREGGDGGFALHARLDGPDGQVDDRHRHAGGEAAGEGGRRVRINGAPARSADDLLEWLRVVWLTPAMDALFTGPAGDRRRFLDRLVLAIDPGHGQRALDYEKAMRGRNRLLAEDSRDGAWFDAIETQMAETGVAIAAARAEMVRPARRHDREAARQTGRSRRPISACPATLESDVATSAGRRYRGELSARRWPRAASATAPPGARWTARTARICWCATGPRHAGRTLLDRRAEGAAGRHRPVACPA